MSAVIAWCGEHPLAAALILLTAFVTVWQGVAMVLERTGYVEDCGGYDCGDCEVCRYLSFRETADHIDLLSSSATPRDKRIEDYLDEKYPSWRGPR